MSAVLRHVLVTALKLLHPFMPFITEELFLQLSDEPSIMISSWPETNSAFEFAGESEDMNAVMELIRSIRNLRAEMKVPPAQRIDVRLIVPEDKIAAYESAGQYLTRLAGAEHISVSSQRGEIPQNDIHIICEGVEAVIPLSSMVDLEKERARIAKEMERLSADIDRSAGKLNNPGFLAKAPQNLVEEEKHKLEAARDMLTKLEQRLSAL